MPINTAQALAVSLIPAAVILVYNIMENGAPGGVSIANLKNFVSSDSSLSESSSSLSLKNISIYINGSAINAITTNDIGSESPTTTTTEASTTTQTTTTTRKFTTVVSSTTTSTTTTKRPTTTTTTTTPVPVILPKLPVCCNSLRVTGDNRFVGNCERDSSSSQETSSGRQTWTVPSHLMGTGINTRFQFQTITPGCKDGKFVGQLPLSTDATSADHFLSDGMLKYKNEYYRPNEYCLRGSGKSGNVLELQICKVNCSNPETPCVHKCCGYDEIYSMGMKGHRGGCMRMDPSKNESLWSPTLYDENRQRLTSEQLINAGIIPHVIQSNPTSFRHFCPRNATTVFPYGQQVADFLSTVLRYPFSSLKFMMRKDGWLMNPNESRTNIAISKSTRTTNYCIDGVMNYGKTEEPFMNIEDQTVLFLCLGAAQEIEASRNTRAESLVAAPSYNQPVTVSPSTTKSPPTTTLRTTQATSSTTMPPSTTSQTTTTTRATTISTTTTEASTTAATTTTVPTTEMSTTVSSTSTTTAKPPMPPPVLPVCCPIDPDNENDDNGNEISQHCKKSIDNASGEKADNSSSSIWTASPNFIHTHKMTKFRLEVKPLKCQKWKKEFVHDLGKLLSPAEPVLMPNGMLKMGNDYYRSGEFCVNGVFRKTVEILVCKTNCSDPLTPCIQKCCAPNEVYSLGVGGKKRGCIPLSEEDTPFDPPLYKNMQTKLTEKELEPMSPHLIQKYPPKFQYNCYKNVTLVFPFSSDVVQLMSPLAQINLEFKLRRDGKVIYKHPSIKDSSGDLIESAFSTFNFCVDGIRHWGETSGPYRNPEDQTILFVCAVNPPN